MKFEFTHTLPKKPGFYWYTNFGEHTPTVLRVTRDSTTGKLFAMDEEFLFEVKRQRFKKDPDLKVDGHYCGEEMWCEIPVPTMDGKQIDFDYY